MRRIRCHSAAWAKRYAPKWTTECIEIFTPDGSISHVHGTWMGWHNGELAIMLSMPFQQIKVGEMMTVMPAAMLWHPLTKRYLYRPRQHMASLPTAVQRWLQNEVWWDTDCVVQPGPATHQ